MNPKPISETESLRSDIEMTRRRMNDTIDALGERMKGRHLVDEVIGYFRSNSDKTSEAGARVREKLSQTAGKVSESAGTAANAVIETVKQNPLPILMITAGAAWLVYNATRDRSADVDEDLEDSDRYDPDTHYDRQLEYPGSRSASSGEDAGAATSGLTDEASSKLGQMKDTVAQKASAAKDQLKDKFSNVKDRASEFGSTVRDRASDISSRVGERTREVYGRSRERVVNTADQYPLQVGLGCLAAGVLIGLAVPTPAPVNRLAGPTIDRLRKRTKDAGRDMLQKGKRVVQAATSAAKQEAEDQGLTPDRLRQSGQAVAERATAAAKDTAKQEGLTPKMGDAMNEHEGAEPADPSATRPAM